MLNYCKDNNIDFKFIKLLISGMKARKSLLATLLLKWYLDNNCVIAKIFQIVEYQLSKLFGLFIDKMTKFRLQGDLDPKKVII